MSKKSVPGFTLIEIVIGSLIAALLAAALFVSINQLRKSARVADQLISVDMRLTVFHNQWMRDLSGAVTPEFGDLEKIFFGESAKDGELQQLTFITVNPLPVFTASAKRLVRVQYQLLPDTGVNTDLTDAYKLCRSESDNLKLAELKNAQQYTMITGIKALKISYLIAQEQSKSNPAQQPAPEQAESAAKDDQSETGKSAKEPDKSVNNSNNKSKPAKNTDTDADTSSESSDQVAGFTVQQSGEFDRLPAYVEIYLELWQDADHQHSLNTKFKFPIYSHKYQVTQQSKQVAAEKQKSESESESESEESDKNNSSNSAKDTDLNKPSNGTAKAGSAENKNAGEAKV